MPRGKRSSGSDKRSFILSLPVEMPAKEVVEKAKELGMRLRDHYVYVVRSNAKKERKTPSGRRQRAVSIGKTSGSAESDFRRLTLELGLGRSKALLQETEQKIADLINGN